jgi:hypothetical protein
LMPPLAVRLRRDFSTVLSLVKAHAILHQATRQRDAKDRISASIEDYANVRDLVAQMVSEGVEAAVPRTIRETVQVVERLLKDSCGETVTVAAVARALGLDNSSALRRVRVAIERGYLLNFEHSSGRAAQLVLDAPLPEDVDVLPSVERLWGCTVASGSEGLDTPPPPAASDGSEGFTS